jgi:hypothetical protein
MAKKWDANELKKLIQLHAVKALALGMAEAQTSMLMRLDRGENVNGGAELYKSDYFKDQARRGAIRGKTPKVAQASGQKQTKKTRTNSGQNYKGKRVDWLLTGDMRRGITIKPPVRKGGSTEITLTVEGGHYSGESKVGILKYNIKRRPAMWGFSTKNFKAGIDAIRKYFRGAEF